MLIIPLIRSNRVKKIESNEDKCPGFSEKRYQIIRRIQEFLKEGCSYREISKRMGIGRNTIAKYREGVFRHIRMNIELAEPHRKYIFENYKNIWELQRCIREFRKVFEKKSVPSLYLFIEKYLNSEIKSLRTFANGLQHDIDAVENAVAYDYSNGFVKGTNNRLKMIKRTMYRRCGKMLLEAK